MRRIILMQDTCREREPQNESPATNAPMLDVEGEKICVLRCLGKKSLPRPLSKLATYTLFMSWLTRALLNILVYGDSLPPPRNIRLLHNLVAFFGLLLYLRDVGHPGHWLSEYLARILSECRVYKCICCTVERKRLIPWLVATKHLD